MSPGTAAKVLFLRKGLIVFFLKEGLVGQMPPLECPGAGNKLIVAKQTSIANWRDRNSQVWAVQHL